MKKVVSVIVVIMLLLLTLTACTPTQSSTAPTTAGSTTAAPTTEPTTAGPPTDLIISWPVFGNEPPDTGLVEDAINALVEPKINVNVDLQVLNFSAASQQYNLMIAGGEQLDLVCLVNAYNAYVSQGRLEDITALVDQYGAGIKEALGDFIKGSYIDGKLYGVRPISDFGGGACLLVREDAVTKYGLDLSQVKTFEDIGIVLRKIKAAEPDKTPLIGMPPITIGQIPFGANIDSLTNNFGVLMDKGQSLKVVNLFETQYYADILNIVREWYTEGLILKDIATSTADLRELVKSDTAYVTVVSSKPGIEDTRPGDGYTQARADFETPLSTTSFISLFQWCVPITSAAPDKAVQFLNLMFTDADLMNLLSNGIEDKHYIKNSDGSIKYPEGVNPGNVGYSSPSFLMGNEFLTDVFEGTDPDIWKQIADFNSSITLSKAMGFSFDPTPVKTELTALDNVYSQYKQTLENGVVDPAKVLPEFIAKLKDAGIDKVIAEKQKQIDAWAAISGAK